MSSHYPDEWSQRMHEALEATEGHLKEMKEINDIAAALHGAACNIRSEEDLRTIAKALANEIAAKIRCVDYIERYLEHGLRLPEAEQAEEE